MLVEVWPHSEGLAAYLPADPVRYPGRCHEIAEADWRYLLRFRGAAAGEVLPAPMDTPFAQTEYLFDGALQAEFEAMLAEPGTI